jgi:hypothetical protein
MAREKYTEEFFDTVIAIQDRARSLQRAGYVVLVSVCSCCQGWAGYTAFTSPDDPARPKFLLRLTKQANLEGANPQAIYQPN